MRKLIISTVLSVMAIATLSSCLGDDKETTVYDDAAITGFSLGTLNLYYTGKRANGTDSIYKRTKNYSKLKFYIDHAKGEIWNPDSLPVEVNAKKIICTISSKNFGTVALKSITSDSLRVHDNRDSVDFSQPREFHVYSQSAKGHRKYTVRVNVHKEQPDSCVWTNISNAQTSIAALNGMKALSIENNIFVFGNAAGVAKIYTSAINDGKNWTELTPNIALSADAYKNVLLKSGAFYCISDGNVLSSADAMNWQVVTATDAKQLIAATSGHLYALSADGGIVSSADNGKTWDKEQLDDDASLLPSESIAYACHNLQTNANADKVILIGNRSLTDYPDDMHTVVWTKIDEYSAGSRSHAWTYLTPSPTNKHLAPRAENWQIISYDFPNIKAISGKGVGKNTTKALSQIYQSGDEGITWLNDSIMKMPAGLSATSESFAMTTDKEKSVWVICGGTGQVWKARINRLVWKKENDYFTE